MMPRYLWTYALLNLAVFLLVLLGVKLGWLQGYDKHILIALHEWTSPTLTRWAIRSSLLGSGWVVTPLAVVALLYVWRQARREAWWLFGSIAGGLLLFLAVSFLVDRPRPTLFDSPVSEPTASFPSGHAMNVTVIFLTLYLTFKRLKSPLATPLGVASLVLLFVVSASRLYLQIHYLSDIVAGVALGTTWVLSLYAFWRIRE